MNPDNNSSSRTRSRSFLRELQRRRLPGFIAGYVVMSWVAIEVASVILPAFEAPDWILRALIIAAVALSPVALILAWFFDLTLHGVVRTDDEPDESDEPVEKIDNSAPAEVRLSRQRAQVEQGEKDSQQEEREEQEQAYAERRLVTVLQCATTIVGGEASEAAENLRNLLPFLSMRYRGIIEEHGGYPGSAEGELITAYFGVATAHEDDSLRAVRAGQEIIACAQSLREGRDQEWRIEATIGVHCGFAIVEPDADMPVEERLSDIGQTLKWVSILQLNAEPNTIRISQAVQELVRGRLPCKYLGTLAMPGSAADAKIYSVESGGGEMLLPGATGSLVGREQEYGLLQSWWQEAMAQRGQAVLLRGEAGIGKSRLVSAIASQVEEDPSAQLIVLQCSSYRTHSMLYPVTRFLREQLNLTPQDHGPEALEALHKYLAECGVSHPDGLTLLGELMALGEDLGAPKLDPERRKTLLLEVLYRVVLTQFGGSPTLLLVEDLHWADPTTLELLQLLTAEISGLRVMMLMTARPAFRSAWSDGGSVKLLSLGRLNREQAALLIKSHDEFERVDAEIIDAIIEKADGVPLFLEEFSRSLLDRRGRGPGPDSGQLEIPNSLQESLTARIHDLGGASSLLHLGATMGREFPHAWLAAASDLSPEQLAAYLGELVDREILFKRGVGESVTYAFKHALVRDAAYNSMLPSRRRECHLSVARVIENRFPVQAERSPELLAQHYSAAEHSPENLRKALTYWLKAAADAAPRSANIEADHFLNCALADLARMPEGEERDRFEVAIQSRRIPLLGALHGYGSEQMGEASRRAMALMDVVEDFENRFMALFSVCVFYMVGGQHRHSFEAAQKIAAICEDQPVAYRVEAHMLLGLNYFFSGELARAKENLLQAIALYDRDEHGEHAYLLGQDPEIVAMAYLAWVYAVSGEFDKLPAHCQTLLDRAESLGHPNSSGYALTFTAWARIYVGDIDQVEGLLEELESMSEQYGLGWSSIQVGILRAFLRCHRERGLDGLEDFERALLAWRAIGSRCFIARWDTYYALAGMEAGALERVPEVISRAEAEIKLSEEFWVESELPRCRGRLAVAKGDDAQAHALFEQSMSLATERQAWGLNLVTACDYAEFLLPTDKSLAATILDGALSKVSMGADSVLEQRAQSLAALL